MNSPWGTGDRRYFPFSQYLRTRFGERVAKIALDAGCTCPNRDGLLGRQGCLFCNNQGFSPNSRGVLQPISEQLRRGMQFYQRRFGINRFMAYFQAYSNTYGELGTLARRYREAVAVPRIVALAVGTRPDCVTPPVLEELARLAENREVWVEYGLQSAHDRTLERMARGHTFRDFAEAMMLTAGYPVKICVHLILGLPGETRDDMLATIARLAPYRYDAVKLHVLHILRDTPLEACYQRGQVRLLELEEYVPLACDLLERIPSRVAVQRLTGDAPEALLRGPDWCRRKNLIQAGIIAELERRGTRQGARVDCPGEAVPADGMLSGPAG